MNKIFFFVLSVFIISFFSIYNINAAEISLNKALSVAEVVNKKVLLSENRLRSADVLTLNLEFVDKDTNGISYYVFNRGNNEGFIIIAGDDRAKPLLGYSTEGSFNHRLLPENLKNWLQKYTKQISNARSEGLKADPAITKLWDNLSFKNYLSDNKSRRVLNTVLWDQGSPYNLKCPVINNTNCMTGCVATAMGIVMKYHQWPVSGSGSYNYTSKLFQFKLSGQLSTTYDWKSMTDQYNSSSTTSSKEAVSQLLFDCGVSVEMDYGQYASGSNTQKAAEALKNNFNYDSSLMYVSRSFYQDSAWTNLIKNEINNNRPIIYDGITINNPTADGHTFVCDGYDGDYFHFNWGWSGYCNGFFALDALNPQNLDSGFNYYQGMIIGIKKGSTSNFGITLNNVPGIEVIPESGYSLSGIEPGGEFKFTIKRSSEYSTFPIVVKANNQVLKPINGVFTIENINSMVSLSTEYNINGGFKKNVLIESYVSEDCVFSPLGINKIRSGTINNNNVFVAEHHMFTLSGNEPVFDKYSLGNNNVYHDFYSGRIGWFTPGMMYNRDVFNDYSYKSPVINVEVPTIIKQKVEQYTSTPALVSVNIKGKYDAETGKVNLGVSGASLISFEGKNMKLNVFVTENGLKGDKGSVYYRTMRKIVTPVWGDDIDFTDSVYARHYQFELNKEWNPDSIQIVAFVSEFLEDSTILAAGKFPLISNMSKVYNCNGINLNSTFNTDSTGDSQKTVYVNIISDVTGNIVTGDGSFTRGSTTNLMAIPLPNYSFDGWYDKNDNLISINNQLSFILDEDCILLAKFSEMTFNVQAGELGNKLTLTEWKKVKTLSLSGHIDVRDFRFINKNLKYISKLDLSSVSISSYENSKANYIPDEALYNFMILKKVVLPESVETLGRRSFSSCRINQINFPDQIKEIKENCFQYADFSGKMVLPVNLEKIASSSFNGCSISAFEISSDNRKFISKDGVLYSYDTTELAVFPKNYQFSLYTIPNTVSKLNASQLYDCGHYEDEAGLRVIDASHCHQLKTIPDEFIFVSRFDKLLLPEELQSISSNALSYSKVDTIVCYSATPPPLTGDSIFYNFQPGTCTLIVPYGCHDRYITAKGWKDFVSIIEMPGFMVTDTAVFLSKSNGFKASIGIKSDTKWTVTTDKEWLNIDPIQGNGNDVINFSMNNNAIHETHASVLIKSGELTKKISVTYNTVPVANAGTDQTVNEGVTVTLDGSASNDPDSNPLTYKWIAPVGITLSSTTVAKPTFVAPDVSADTDFIFTLVVNDGIIDSQPDEVVVKVKFVVGLQSIKDDDVEIYPNPVKDMVNIKFDREPMVGTQISVYDFTGKVVMKSVASGKDINLDLSSVQVGPYFIRIDQQTSKTYKIVKE